MFYRNVKALAALVGTIGLIFSTQNASAQADSLYNQLLTSHSYGAEREAHEVFLGFADDPATNVTSITFSFGYDMDAGEVDFYEPESWLADGGSTQVTESYDAVAKVVTIKIDRVTGGPKTGHGLIGHMVMDGVGITDNFDIRQRRFSVELDGVTRRVADVEVFPQPAHDQVYLRPEGDLQHLVVRDLQGREQLRMETPGTELSVAGWAPGVYFLTGETTAGPFQERLIVQ